MLDFERWNELLGEFLEELHIQFPDDRNGVSVFRVGLATASAFDVRKPCETFMAAVTPHESLLTSKDPHLFKSLGTIAGVDFDSIWTKAQDEQTRDAIFEYVLALYTLGSYLLENS